MSTVVTDHRDKNRFEIHLDGELMGFADYERDEKTISFIHTEIDPVHRGQGLASQLIEASLDAALRQALEVLPYCPFVHRYIDRHRATYLNLVPVDLRERFDLD